MAASYRVFGSRKGNSEMKALAFHKPGALDQLHLRDMPVPEPGEGEVLIRVHAAGINPADWKIVEMGVDTWRFPMIAGLDASGTVERTGPGVDGWKQGDRVVYHGSFQRLGAFAEFTAQSAHVLARLPHAVTFEQAAAMPTAGYTAYQAIEEVLRPRPEDTILVHAGAGGLGGYAIQLAKLRGATVFTTCSAANADYVRSLGADAAIDYTNVNTVVTVRELTHGRGVDAVLETIGTVRNRQDALDMLAFQGWLLLFNGLPDFSKLGPLSRGIRICDIALGAVYIAGDKQAQTALARYGEALGKLVAEGTISTMIEDVVSLEDAGKALARNRAGHQRGRLVVTLNKG